MTYKIKKVNIVEKLGPKEAWKFLCPGCAAWGYIDDDQLNGQVSIQCYCGFHETINLKEKARVL